jgi:hypothetical protein
MAEPAIKGSAVTALVEDVARCLEEGRVSLEEVEARLEPEDVALLEEKISPAKWYPIDQYRRLTDLLFEFTGDGRDFETYLKERGAAAAERLMQSGLYQQLDYSTRQADANSEQTSREQLRRETRLRLSLIAGIVNRGSADIAPDPDRPDQLRIELRDASEIPDCLGHTIAGFIERCARERRAGGVWHMSRIGADVMRFTYVPHKR